MKKTLFLLLFLILTIPSSLLLAGTTGLVNDFEGIDSANGQWPPTGTYNDISAWAAVSVFPNPTPVFWPYYQDIATQGADAGAPAAPPNGNDMMRIIWDYRTSYLCLTFTCFENATQPNQKNWSNYDYINFVFASNLSVNGKPNASQYVTILDGAGGATSVTFTTINNELPIMAVTDTAGTCVMNQHLAVSMNYLANYYDTTIGRYFDPTNISSFTINAPDMTYSGNEIVMYYDYLTLGAHSGSTPFWSNPPSGVTVTTIGTMPLWTSVNISWTAPAPTTGQCPITGYHIYRTIGNAGSAAGPWVSVAIVPNTVSFTPDAYPYNNFASTGGTFCYKVLTLDNGPANIGSTGSGDIISNTINATFDEAPLANANAVCITLPPVPTNTSTPCPLCSPTNTPAGCGPPICTVTFTVTMTPMPTATVCVGCNFNNVYVYPNPFNPNMGTRTFHVGNVATGTKVYIYDMAGQLVNEGVVAATNDPACTTCYEWDGKNKNNTLVVTGLYFVVLESADNKTTKVQRVTVCHKCNPVYIPGQ